jgi:hypothetical protein
MLKTNREMMGKGIRKDIGDGLEMSYLSFGIPERPGASNCVANDHGWVELIMGDVRTAFMVQRRPPLYRKAGMRDRSPKRLHKYYCADL